MTKFFLRFLKIGNNSPVDAKARGAVGKLSGAVGIAANLLLFAGKLVVGTLSGSLSITADAMNNLSDASSSIVTFLGFKLAEKPADSRHPYGHARYEYLSGLAVAALILVIGVDLAKSSVLKILNPEPVAFTWVTALVLILSIGAKLWLSLFNGKLSKLINSTTLAATAQDSRNDCIATGAVLVAALAERFFSWQIDGFVGLGVALFILYSGLVLGKETISPLLGENASPELQELIVDYVRSQEKVLGYHDLMVHDYGPGRRFATLHVEISNEEDPLTCHELIDDMERECLQNHNIHLVIHYDPVVTDDPELDHMRESTSQLLQQLDEKLQLHDFRMVRGGSHTNLIFDVALPNAWVGREAEIRAHLEEELSKAEQTRIYTVITFDLAAFNQEV